MANEPDVHEPVAIIIASAHITISFSVDIIGVYWYYKLQPSISTAPTTPTSTVTVEDLFEDGWADIEPTYTEGSTETLYILEETRFSDGTHMYSNISVSSSYLTIPQFLVDVLQKENSSKKTINDLPETHVRNLNLFSRMSLGTTYPHRLYICISRKSPSQSEDQMQDFMIYAIHTQ